MSETYSEPLNLAFSDKKGGHGGKNTRMRERVKVETPSDQVLDKYFTHYEGNGLYGGQADIDLPNSATFFDKPDETMVVDFGCGRGEYVVAQAKANPDKHYVGIDEHAPSLYFGVHEAAEAELDNVHFVRGNIGLLTPYIEDESIEASSVLFPAPIIQAKNKGKDVLSERFINELHRTMVKSGEFNFATDATEYFSHKVNFITGAGGFALRATSREIEPAVTRYQKQWQNKGIQTNRAIFDRV